MQARDARLIGAGWRLAVFSSAVGGGAATVAVLSGLAGTVPWWGVLGWAAASAGGFLFARSVIRQNVRLLCRVLDIDIAITPRARRDPSTPDRLAHDGEDDDE